MNHKFAQTLAALLCIALISCNKGSGLTEREKQIIAEETAILLPHEIREQEGIRFVLNYDQRNARIALKLFKGTGSTVVQVPLQQEQPYVNYAIVTDSLVENSEFILQADYESVTAAGNFEVTVIGFTNLNFSKRFTISNLSFTPTAQGTTKNIIRISKGINKYAFFSN